MNCLQGHKRWAPLLLAAALLTVGGCRTPRPGAAATPARPTDPPAEALALFGRALLHEYRGELREATEALAAALATAPDDEQLNVRLAGLLLRQRRAEEAVAVVAQWVARKPGDPARLRWLARTQIGAERLDDAAATFARALAADPTSAETVAELAALHLRRDKGREAAALLANAVGTARPLLPLLKACHDTITWAEARNDAETREALAKVLPKIGETADGDVNTLLALGNAYRRLNRLDEATTIFERAAAAAPTDERAVLMAALMLAAQNREAEALKRAEQGVARVRQPLDLLRLVADLRNRAAARAATPEEAREHRLQAIAALRRVLAARPADAALRLALGDLLILTGQPEEALREFRRIEADDPDLRRRLALRFVAAGDVAAAIERFEALAAAQPRNSQIHHYLGELYAARKDREKAMRAFRSAIAGDAPEPTAFIRLAALQAAENTDDALQTLREGERRFPEDLRLPEARAQLHALRREFAEARAILEALESRTAADSPGEINPVFLARVAHIYALDDRPNEAVERLQRAMGIEPLALEVFVRLAAAPPATEEEQARARRALEALDAVRGDVLTAMYFGIFEHFVKRHGAAIRHFEAAIERSREQTDSAELLKAPFYFWFGAALEREGQMDRAAEMLLKAIELDPNDHRALNYLAYSWADRGLHLDRALELVRRALELDPNNGAYLDTLGWIYFRQGRFEEALAELRRALDLEPEEWEILDHYGDALRALGRTEEAIPFWKRAFVRQPESQAIREKLLQHGVDIEPLEREAAALKADEDRRLRLLTLDDEPEREAPPSNPVPGFDLAPDDLEKLNAPEPAP